MYEPTITLTKNEALELHATLQALKNYWPEFPLLSSDKRLLARLDEFRVYVKPTVNEWINR